ncbi:phage holin family protein [Streptomyces sp. NRRL B-24484]|uniref:phage holin family protein n=1 Tax=Streptomyces sp. NRRL B-24484 TaxID=1463833 RepID=UPI001F2459BA|nr:phage holin family protein [Streptomyces sp. NRRL B-24484]
MKASVNGSGPATTGRPDRSGGFRTDGRPRPVDELVHEAAELASQLVRQEWQLARTELTAKGRRAGRGGGLFGGAGLLAVIGLQAFVAAAIAALALVIPLWGAALVMGGLLTATAGLLALAGRGEPRKAGSPVPERAVETTRTDTDVIKERAHR